MRMSSLGSNSIIGASRRPSWKCECHHVSRSLGSNSFIEASERGGSSIRDVIMYLDLWAVTAIGASRRLSWKCHHVSRSMGSDSNRGL